MSRGGLTELADILAELEPTLGARESEPAPLDGGITNRNFRVAFDGREYVIRLHGRDTELLGIDRLSERLATQAAASLGLAPEIAAVGEEYLVTRFVACATLTPAQVAAEAQSLGKGLRSFHERGPSLPSRFAVPELLERYERLVRERGGALPAAYGRAAESARRVQEALREQPLRPCHNDLLSGNIIRARDGGAVMIVDWEYAGMGDPRFDLGNLAVNNDFDEERQELLLEGYLGRPPRERERAALSLMRIASDAREAAWGVLQGVLSDLEFDFAGYASEHFERLLAAVARPEFERQLGLVAG